MRFVLPFLLALAAGVLPAMAADVDQSAYLSLKPGNDWTLDMVIVAPSGETKKAIGRRRVEDTVEKDGKTYVRLRTWTENGPTEVEYTKLVRKDGDGMYSILEGFKEAKEQLEIALPLKTGSAWKREASGMKFIDVIIGIEPVTIGTQTYAKCFHIRTESADGKYREDYWEAPKVGNVKSEIVTGNGMRITLTLREFKEGK
jgi:hypothetical protein